VFANASASAATKPAAQAAAVSWPTVRPGAKGERVRTIQLLLNQRGYPVAVDGVYGSSTTNAVKAFQKVIKVSADGRVLWLSGRWNAEVYVISTRTGRLIKRNRVGPGPHGLSVYPHPARFSLGRSGGLRCALL